MKFLIHILFILSFYVSGILAAHLPALFADNMVLQQNTSIKIWGNALPSTEIFITAEWGKTCFAVTGQDGNWICDLQTPAAGGPFYLKIQDKDSLIEIKNIMIGEVWFCSGQSNMEMPLSGWPPNDPIMNSEQEIKEADYPQIRMFTVARNASFKLQDDVTGSWQVCTPKNAPGFSATAYFFGRKLFKELNVPIGLIHSSWGGTPAQAWVEASYLQKYEEYSRMLEQVDTSTAVIEKYNDWLKSLPSVSSISGIIDGKWSGFDFKDKQLSGKDFDDSQWKTMQLPRLWETTDVGQIDGTVWFRKKVELPDDFISKKLVLELGPIDDIDITWFNGQRIGAHEELGFYSTPRRYTISADLVKKENVIAVRVIDNTGGGGIYGSADNLKIYPENNPDNSITLAGEWKYLPVAIYRNAMFYTLDIASQQFYQHPKLPVQENPGKPSTLYNGMVHPVIPYTIKGAIWYQGEANVGNPSQYEELFPDLINNWRKDWGQGNFPFYFVQIAPWNYGVMTESQYLRDAQRKSLKLKNTGMAVTVDIGDVRTIHPANKQDVGKRLALWALAKDYGKNLVYSGPLYKSMEVKGSSIIISFDHVAKGLKYTGDKPDHFIIAAADKNFSPASVEIKGDKIVVSHPDVKNPVAVRYLWDNTSAGNLFNSAGLPASSFRTDDW